MARMGFAATSCPPSPALEAEFYPNPVTIAVQAHSMVRRGSSGWTPDPQMAALTDQLQFKGPF